MTRALHFESAQSQQADFEVESGNLTLDAMFPPDVVKCVTPIDLHRLRHLLENSVQSPLSDVAWQCEGVRDKKSSQAKASTISANS
jgi:hypothetical protein